MPGGAVLVLQMRLAGWRVVLSRLGQQQKVWARSFRAPPFTLQNCKFLIALFDYFEEDPNLSMAELQVRDDCRSRLAEIIKEQAAYWK